MKLSVIIPTYNRSGALKRLIESLNAQTAENFEIVIVNDGSTDDTASYLSRLTPSKKYILKVHHLQNSGRAAARNFGARRATGDLLIFFDDDVRPCPTDLETRLNFHNSNDGILYGPYYYDLTNQTDPFVFFRSRLESRWYKDQVGLTLKSDCSINGGCFSIKANEFWEVNGFDEKLKDKEDFKIAFDYQYKKNGRIYLYDAVGVYHDDFKNYKQYIKRVNESKKEALLMLHLYPEINMRYRRRYVLPDCGLLKKVIFRIFGLPLFDFIPSSQFIGLLPQRIQDRLYAFFLTARTSIFD